GVLAEVHDPRDLAGLQVDDAQGVARVLAFTVVADDGETPVRRDLDLVWSAARLERGESLTARKVERPQRMPALVADQQHVRARGGCAAENEPTDGHVPEGLVQAHATGLPSSGSGLVSAGLSSAAPALRSRFSSFFFFFARSRWRLANA